MLKTTILTAISFSALLITGYLKKTPSENVNEYSMPGVSSMYNKPVQVSDTTKLKVGDKSPDIIFRDSTGQEGQEVRLSQFKGKYVLIDVWATWCYPCRVQYPQFKSLAAKMKDKQIVFLSISLDAQRWRWRGPELIKMGGIQWIVKDKTFERKFGVNTIPRYILLDKKGNILNLNMPMPSHPELEEELYKLKGI